MSNQDLPELPASIADYLSTCLDELDSQRFARRILDHDAGLWRGNEEETQQRLGWLHVHESMPPLTQSLSSFAAQARTDGFRDAVLLGMGGSSLGAEVLSQVIGTSPGHLRLHVLDSTVPGAVRNIRDRIDLPHTLFIVSSKSGGTLEPNVLLQYFWHETLSVEGDNAGSHFIAITDAGSSLEALARENRFREVFLNPSDIGGRYSVLSLFGLVPGALMGIDPTLLLERALLMKRHCPAHIAARDCPSAWLGAYLAACTRSGRNKLTILTSPRLRSFGLWAEQLIAESIGKEGTGIVPVSEEPLLSPKAYSGDRTFVYIRLSGDQCDEMDAHAASLKESGQPCTVIELPDTYALGTEFFRWEYATAVTGALLGVNPFDQPDVQSAKDASTAMLRHYESHREFPQIDGLPSLKDLIGSAAPPDYVAIMAYLHQTPEMDAVFHAFRRTVSEKHGGLATTLGYGPRYLHSTGQLHKGGPDECVLLQFVCEQGEDVPVPEKSYSFGIVAEAQALGDLQALRSLNRRVTRIVLKRDSAEDLAQALRDSL